MIWSKANPSNPSEDQEQLQLEWRVAKIAGFHQRVLMAISSSDLKYPSHLQPFLPPQHAILLSLTDFTSLVFPCSLFLTLPGLHYISIWVLMELRNRSLNFESFFQSISPIFLNDYHGHILFQLLPTIYQSSKPAWWSRSSSSSPDLTFHSFSTIVLHTS